MMAIRILKDVMAAVFGEEKVVVIRIKEVVAIRIKEVAVPQLL